MEDEVSAISVKRLYQGNWGRWVVALIAVAGIWFGVWFFNFSVTGTARDSMEKKDMLRRVKSSSPGMEVASRIRHDDGSIGKQSLLTSSDAPEIVAIRNQLKALEQKRTVFCREVEKNGATLQNFIVSAPSPEEVDEMMKLLSQVKGLTKDRDLNIISWKERLREDFLWPEKFRQCILTTIYDEPTKRWKYIMLGVTEGNMLMRDGNAPMPADGKIHIIRMESAPDGDEWRFSHLFSTDKEAGE